jgi:CYTH domain-containing protein
MNKQDTELKWRLDKIPTDVFLSKHITQTFLCLPKLPLHERRQLIDQYIERVDWLNVDELRLTKLTSVPVTTIYVLTLKMNVSMKQDDIEIRIEKDHYEALLQQPTIGFTVVKHRGTIAIPHTKSLSMQVDVYSSQLSGLVIAKLEFNSAQ